MKSQLFQLAAVALLAAGALATSTTTNEDASSSAPSRPTSGNSGECQYPADVLDLQSWKVTLPTGGDDAEEIKQPELATFAADPWFVATENCDGIRFRSAVNGATTGNSAYPRSELREMVSDGSDEAGWSTTEGTHTLTAKLAFTATPNDKPHVVGAQVHGGDDDVTVFRLEGTELWITDGDEPHHHLITDNYQLGTVFEAKFVASTERSRPTTTANCRRRWNPTRRRPTSRPAPTPRRTARSPTRATRAITARSCCTS